jgi:hypothetical protein
MRTVGALVRLVSRVPARVRTKLLCFAALMVLARAVKFSTIIEAFD